jgi:dihydroorotase
VVDPASGVDRRADVLIRNGHIEAILGEGENVSPDIPRMNATGLMVTPGFVDLHAHFRYPGQSHKETIASATASAIRGGFTTVCAMANTSPAIDSPLEVEDVLTRGQEESRCHLKTFAGVSKGLHGHDNTDAGALLAAGAIGLSDDGNPVESADIMRRALNESNRLGFPVSAHEERRADARNSDPFWPCASEVDMVRRDINLARTTGGKLHIAHVSCRESLELIEEAKSTGIPVTAEATPHHIAMTDAEWGGAGRLPTDHGFAKVNPPLRSELDREALVRGLVSGVIDAIATDHAPHTSGDKCGGCHQSAFGFSGFEFALPLCLELVSDRQIEFASVIERLTIGPARVLGINAGSLAPGAAADVCILDPNESWVATSDAIVSKGKNNPRMGSQLRGRVVATIVSGHVHHFGRDHELRAIRTS